MLMLAQNEAVQKEIEATTEQVAEINKVVEAQRAERGPRGGGGERPDFRNMSEEERNKFFQEMRERREKQNKEADEKLKKILIRPQIQRIEEIRVQMLGLAALLDDEISKKLKITANQKKEIEKAMTESRESMGAEIRKLFEGADREGDREQLREQMRKKMEELRKKSEENVLGVLNSGQKKQFEQMKGEEFEMPRFGFGRGPSRRGPGAAREGRPGGPRGEGRRGQRPKPEGD